MEAQSTTKPGFWHACFLASRPKTIPASIIPILVGTFLAQANGAAINTKLFICVLFSILFIHLAVNYINDAIDFCKGADTEERLGPDRVTQKKWLSVQQVMGLGFFSILLSFLFGIPLIMQGGYVIMAILIISASLAYFYTGGPYPLAYLGLGELFVLIFFGFVITTVPYYLQTLSLDYQILLAGFQMGCLNCIFILINNLRDIYSDRKAKKMTTAARFGKHFARIELTIFTFLPYAANLAWLFFDKPFAALFPILTLPMAVFIIKNIWTVDPSRRYNRFFGLASLLIIFFGIFLILGILIK